MHLSKTADHLSLAHSILLNTTSGLAVLESLAHLMVFVVYPHTLMISRKLT